MATKPEDMRGPVGTRGLLRAHRRVPRRVHDAVRTVDDHRRADASGARDRLPDRQALQVGSGRARRRRATPSSSVIITGPTAGGASTPSPTRRLPATPRRWPSWAKWLLESSDSPVHRYTPDGAELDSVFDVKVVYQQDHTAVDLGRVPEVFLPRNGPFELIDYEKVYAADPARRHLRGCAASTAAAPSWWCAPTTTSRTCCRWPRPTSWPSSSGRSCFPGADPSSSRRADSPPAPLIRVSRRRLAPRSAPRASGARRSRPRAARTRRGSPRSQPAAARAASAERRPNGATARPRRG